MSKEPGALQRGLVEINGLKCLFQSLSTFFNVFFTKSFEYWQRFTHKLFRGIK